MWEEGVHIYGTPGVHNNFSVQSSHKIPSNTNLLCVKLATQFLLKLMFQDMFKAKKKLGEKRFALQVTLKNKVVW